VLKGVQARARQDDYSVFVADSDEDRTTEEQLLRAMAKQVDGVIVCSPGIDDTQLYESRGDHLTRHAQPAACGVSRRH